MTITPGKPIRTYNSQGNWRDWSTDELVGQRLNLTLGWKCGAGVENLYIDMDGDVWGASCRVGGKFGNIFTGFSLPNEWVTCTKKLCTCGSDLFIPKVKNLENYEILRKTQGLPTINDKFDPGMTQFEGMERSFVSTRKQIYWEIGRRCNYDCSYCWSWIHNNTDQHKNLEVLIQATNLLHEKFTKGQSVNFIISGGEPTANPAFIDWLRYLHSFDHKISLHSNGSRKPEYYREIIHYGDLNLSVHFEFYNRERFVQVVKAIADERANSKQPTGHLEVKFMMAPHNHNEAISLENELKDLPYFKQLCTSAFVPIRGSMNNKNISVEDLGKNNSDEVMQGYTEDQKKLFGSHI
jgi:organic radical activating enzyme